MRLLITNDDGWDAPGLACLRQVAARFGEVFSVAPLDKRSGCGHQLTFDRPLAFEPCGGNCWRVNGMPGDCVRLAIDRLGSFDQVWSGINEGANLGVDQYLSGTVAAAREAAILGLPAIALSQYHRGPWLESDWELTAQVAERVLVELSSRPAASRQLWNVNLPDLRTRPAAPAVEIIHCPSDPSPLPPVYRHEGDTSYYAGRYADRSRLPGHDVEACFGGAVTVSMLTV
jgi:5'-nucleotidase